jgi:hypothetical protein
VLVDLDRVLIVRTFWRELEIDWPGIEGILRLVNVPGIRASIRVRDRSTVDFHRLKAETLILMQDCTISVSSGAPRPRTNLEDTAEAAGAVRASDTPKLFVEHLEWRVDTRSSVEVMVRIYAATEVLTCRANSTDADELQCIRETCLSLTPKK